MIINNKSTTPQQIQGGRLTHLGSGQLSTTLSYPLSIGGSRGINQPVSVSNKQYFKAQILTESGAVVSYGTYENIVAEFFDYKESMLYGYSDNRLSFVTNIPEGYSIRIVPVDEDENYKQNLLRMKGGDVQAVKNFIEVLVGSTDES